MLTANRAHALIAARLNDLLVSEARHEGSEGSLPPRPFVSDETVRYVQTGRKIRMIYEIVQQRGFTLATGYPATSRYLEASPPPRKFVAASSRLSAAHGNTSV